MKIYRKLHGKNIVFGCDEIGIELTDEEMYAAFLEKQDQFDREDVENYTTAYYAPEDFKDVFGLTVEEFRPLMDEVVDEYRDRPIDCYEEVQGAAFTVLQRHRRRKEAQA